MTGTENKGNGGLCLAFAGSLSRHGNPLRRDGRLNRWHESSFVCYGSSFRPDVYPFGCYESSFGWYENSYGGNEHSFGPNVNPCGPNVNPCGPNVNPSGPNVNPFSPNVDPFGCYASPFRCYGGEKIGRNGPAL